MTLSTDPSYAALARSAAAAMGAGSPDMARAILAQWQCELGAAAPWPPPRNNPGNIARGLAGSLGLPYTVAPAPNPQPSNPIVTFPTASVGAQAYAAAIATQSRYRSALNAARAGNGEQFIRAIGSSGWGTSPSCMLGVYRSAPTAPTSGVVLASSTGAAACQSTLASLGVPTDPTHQLTAAEAGAIVHRMDPNFGPGDKIYDEAVSRLSGMTVGHFCASGTINASDPLGQIAQGVAGIQQEIAGLANLSWLPGLMVSAGVLGIAAYLVVSGVRDILGDVPPEAALLA